MNAESDPVKKALAYLKEMVRCKWEKEALEDYEEYKKEQNNKCQTL